MLASYLQFRQTYQNYFASPSVAGLSINEWTYIFLITAIFAILVFKKHRLTLIPATILLALFSWETLQISQQISKMQDTKQKFMGKTIHQKYIVLHGNLYLFAGACKKELPLECRAKLILAKNENKTAIGMNANRILSYHLIPIDTRGVNIELPVNYGMLYDWEKERYKILKKTGQCF